MKKSSFFRSPVFWTGFVALSLASSLFLVINFEKANPLVNLTVRMDRAEALAHSSVQSEAYKLGPEGYRQAASFLNDTPFQNYTELEGGGLEAFNQVTGAGTYHSYQWHVRHFRENEINEVTFFYTPEGTPYGFREIISEELMLPAVTSDSARVMVHNAAERWGVQLAEYDLAEKSTVENLSGRIDHHFAFERREGNTGDSKFRASFTISGNKLTRVEHYVKIPEDFERRFTEMRSNNSLVNQIGQVFLFLIYGLIGIGLILFVLIRERYFLWKKALWWAVGIGLATGLIYTWNTLPLLWFDYDTSSSAASFVTRNLMNGLLNTLFMGGIIFLSAMAGEGFSRYLFPGHVQLWKSWGRAAGGSKQVLGLTVGAYLFVPVFLAIDVLYFLITTRYLGWWNPAGVLSDPNVLAETLPWYSSIAISLQAGFWEELICRAVPLAGVYYLVRNRRSKNFWMLLTLLAQAIIFGMLHANYPQSPSFARVFEMIVPFVIFGLVYLRFGLLPLIIAHFAVDVFWISLPLFVANTPGIWINRFIIIILLFVPLWIVLYYRIRNGKWNEAPDHVLNKGWIPAPKAITEDTSVEEIITSETSPVKWLQLKWLLPVSLAGLFLWIILSFPVRNDAPAVKMNKTEAVETARKILDGQFQFDPMGWKVMTRMQTTPSKSHRFVWLTSREEYPLQQERFLSPPCWVVHFVKTTAGTEERIEEYSVTLGIDGRLLAFHHILPEKREGLSFGENEATQLALETLDKILPDSTEGLKRVKITPSKLEARTDWTLEFSDTLAYTLEKGQGRYRVKLAGSQVSGFEQFVFIPEEWEREYDKKNSSLRILTTLSILVFYLMLILGIVLGIVNWSKRKFSMRLFLVFSAGFILLSVLGIVNDWDSLISSYFTGIPYTSFLIMTTLGLIIGFLFMGFATGVLGGYSCQLAANDGKETKDLFRATMAGFILAGGLAVIDRFTPWVSPRWISLEHLNSELPFFGLITGSLSEILFRPLYAMILFYLSNTLSRNFTLRKPFALLVIFIGSFLIAGSQAGSVQGWLFSGAVYGLIICILYLFLHRNIGWLPVVFVISFLLERIGVSFTGDYPSIFWVSLPSAVIAFGIAVYWQRQIRRCNQH